MMRAYILSGALLLSCVASAGQPGLSIELQIPRIDSDPYHQPYIAVWLETPQREAIATLAVWHERDTWLKDLRQWWRKIGRRSEITTDGVSGATRKPGIYHIEWQAQDSAGRTLDAGEYLLNIEAVREEGDRSYLRQTVTLGKASTQLLPAAGELGLITVRTR